MRFPQFIYPLFFTPRARGKTRIPGFGDIARLGRAELIGEVKSCVDLGLETFLLFPTDAAKHQDTLTVDAYAPYCETIAALTQAVPEATVMLDVCLCGYLAHGHCGIVKDPVPERGTFIDNAKTLRALAGLSVAYAQAGAHWVAPSAMAKGQVAAIRAALDKVDEREVGIMGYSAKFASTFYGPFRNACDSAPRFGDRRSYQLGWDDKVKALDCIAADIVAGADIVMVKPALAYLDVIAAARERFPDVRLAAYNVSGEYAQVVTSAQQGLCDRTRMIDEVISAIVRAGADTVISYHAKEIYGRR